jgi:hypothetical protein
MIKDQEVERLIKQELKTISSNIIWQDENGIYEVFGRYRIVPNNRTYRVFCSETEVGIFYSTRAALSWCIADKYNKYALAREILTTDNRLHYVVSDIVLRAGIATQSKSPEFRENVETKLEPKLIHKKKLENQLADCVKMAKYWQQRGFNNETARTSRN